MAETTRGFLQRHQDLIRGETLDLGAGSGKYRAIIAARASSYTATDSQPGDNIDVVADVHALPFGAASYDTVVSTQVMEHVREPWKMVEEVARILRPSGTCILTAPFMLQYHADPSDYYRYTTEGIRHLCERAGLTVIETGKIGGAMAVLAESMRFSWLNPYAGRRYGFIRRNLVRSLHALLMSLDRVSPQSAIYATTAVVARKPA